MVRKFLMKVVVFSNKKHTHLRNLKKKNIKFKEINIIFKCYLNIVWFLSQKKLLLNC